MIKILIELYASFSVMNSEMTNHHMVQKLIKIKLFLKIPKLIDIIKKCSYRNSENETNISINHLTAP